MKKQITFLLLMAMLLSTAACGGETGKDDVTTAGAETTSSAIGESADPDSRDSVPSAITEDLDFKGATITVLTRDKDEFVNEFKAEEETGDTINDAVYARNLAVEDKLKVKLEVMSRNGDWGQHTQFNADVIKEVMAGDTSYDVISYFAYAMPMFDEAQEHYYSLANDNYSQIAVPATVKDPEAVGAFLELMGEYSYKKVTPAYYEVAMKGKYLRDDESCQMFDIIIDGAWYDFANINTSVIGDPVFITRQAQYHRDGKNFASMWASRKDELTEKLNSLLENYKNS